MKLALAQLAPVWLDRTATLAKIQQYISDAATAGAQLICFGETLLPGYPFWLSTAEGAAFDNRRQKELHAHYLREAVCIERGDLDSLRRQAKQYKIAIYLGVAERPTDRGGHSIYCSLIYIDAAGIILSVHRKLQPTYEERLVWAPGDGHGLRTHRLREFTIGGLNCWENWMPLSRAALYAQGEDLHVAVWPGAVRNTVDSTRFMALEGRSYVASVSGLLRKSDIPEGTPHRDFILSNCPEIINNGGTCLAAPDGSWVIEPTANEEALLTAEININRVLEERQNFDPAGHYSRPDVTRLILSRKRQSLMEEE